MDSSPAACTVVSCASTDVEANVMVPLPSNPAMFLAISFLSFSETGLTPPVAAFTTRDRGSMVAVISLPEASSSTVKVAFQLEASSVRSWPALAAMPARPVFT